MGVLSLLDWDSHFFKKKIGKIIWNKSTNPTQLIQLFQGAQNENYNLIYLFSSTEIKSAILESFNGKLVDTKLTFEKVLSKKQPIIQKIESYSNKEIDTKLFELAYLSGTYSRFKKDKNFTSQDFTILYDQWLKKSITREIADEVFVYIEKKEIIGFVTVKIKDNSGHIGLIAVNPNHQGKNIGTHLLNQVENFLFTKNITKLFVPTQKVNELACNFYEKNNFKIISSQYIYHFAINS